MTVCERAQVTSVVTEIVKACRERWPDAEIYYTGTLPRFVERCCGRKDHMTVDDPQVINNSRKELDREIVAKLVGERLEVTVLDWWEMLGMQGEPTVRDMMSKKILSADNVHLTAEANKNAAVYLCRRLVMTEGSEYTGGKRRRLY